MYLVAAVASLLAGLYLIVRMVKESAPEPIDQDTINTLAEETDNRIPILSPLL